MAKRRMLHDKIWTSQNNLQWTLRQRLLFIGLISNADDQGRVRAHPSLIRSQVFPYDDFPASEVVSDLEAIAKTQAIEIYENSETPYLQILNWWQYQKPQWAQPSDIPAMPDWADRIRYRKDNRVLTCNWLSPKGKAMPDSCDTQGQPMSEFLGGALPKAPPNTFTKDPTWAHSDSDSDSDSTVKEQNATHSVPNGTRTFQEWMALIKQSSNRTAVLHDMFEDLYPQSVVPDYPYLGKVAREVGGAGRLADLLWQNCTRPPTGDVLAYCLKAAKGQQGQVRDPPEPSPRIIGIGPTAAERAREGKRPDGLEGPTEADRERAQKWLTEGNDGET